VELIIPNASVISALDTLDCFKHLGQLCNMKNWVLVIPRIVIEEAKSSIDFSKFTRELKFRTYTVDMKDLLKLRNRFPALAEGELAVLLLVLHYEDLDIKANSATAILDDKVARNVAKMLEISHFGTLKLLKIMQDTGIITRSQFYAFISKLKDSGFRFTDEIVRRIVG